LKQLKNMESTPRPDAIPATGKIPGRNLMAVSFVAGFVQLLIKIGAAILTGSAAVFADAVESAVHVLAVGFAFFSLHVAARPPDRDHPYGHAKIGFFSAGVEGGIILMAALFIIGDSARRIWQGPQLEEIGWGIALTGLTVILNLILGSFLIYHGRKHHQLILTANGKHVLTDAWTSLGVIAGLSMVQLTGWVYWDPLLAILVGANILRTGTGLVSKGFSGLMDSAQEEDLRLAEKILGQSLNSNEVTYHALRLRNLGQHLSIDLHLVFEDRLSIREAHDIATVLEHKLSSAFHPPAVVMTHLEPRHDHERLHGPPG
jgi:cation diffusion facilitator family transporter